MWTKFNPILAPSPFKWTFVDILHHTYSLSRDQLWTFYSPPPSHIVIEWTLIDGSTSHKGCNCMRGTQIWGNLVCKSSVKQIKGVFEKKKRKVCVFKKGKRWRPYFYSTNSHNSFLGRAALGRVPCGTQKKSSDSSPGCNLNNSSKFSCGSITAGVISIGWTLWEWVDFFFFLFLQWHIFALPVWLVPHKSSTWI